MDPDTVAAWSERQPDICRNYSPRDRFNADETGFLWRQTQPKRSALEVKMYRGEKEQRTRDGYGSLQSGWHRQDAPVSNLQIRQPRCFGNSNMDLLPVTYKSQKNAWMDNVLFQHYLQKVDCKMKVANLHILLFLLIIALHTCQSLARQT